jgi:hypothetical protein
LKNEALETALGNRHIVFDEDIKKNCREEIVSWGMVAPEVGYIFL